MHEQPAAVPEEEPGPVPGTEIERRLREAGGEELLALVREHAGEIEPAGVRQVLRNAFCAAEVIEILAAQTRLLSFYEVRRDLAVHPRTPEALALRFVPGLFWRDLSALGLDPRVRPRVRRAADLHLAMRLPEMAVGEKVTIARRASPGVIAQLRHDPSPRVIAALLDNSRLTEDLLFPVVHGPATPGPVLALIAADRRWGVRYGLQVALCRNPGTPLAAVLRILPLLRKPELRAVAQDPRLAEPLRLRARVLLGEAG